MPIPIPVPKGASSTASASVVKHDRCAACGCEFVYVVEYQGHGEGSTFLYGLSAAATEEARRQARQQAEAALQQQIASRTRDVTCPACGRVPAAAVARKRALTLGLCLAPAVVLAGFALAGKVSPEMTPVVSAIAIGLAVLGACGAMLIRSRVAVPAEPNDLAAVAKRLARGRAVRMSTFDAIMAGRQARAEPHSQETPPAAPSATGAATSGKGKVAAGVVIAAALFTVIGYGVYRQRAAAAAAADAAFAHAERRFNDAETAMARFEVQPSLDAYRDAVKADNRTGNHRYRGKTFAEMDGEWETSYRQQIADSSPQLIEAAADGRVSLMVVDQALGEFAPESQPRFRAAVKDKFDAIAAERAKTADGRGEVDALLAQMRDDSLNVRWQSLRRRPMLDLAARTYLLEFKHVVPDEKGELQPLDAGAKFFESEDEQRARQSGSTTLPTALREREGAWNNLREPLETTIRDSLLGQSNGQNVEIHPPDHRELTELGPALAGAVRGRIGVSVAWGFSGFRARGHDYTGRIQYTDRYVPREALVVVKISSTRGGKSTWDGRHVAYAKAEWTVEDENAPAYRRDGKITPDKQLASQVMQVLQRKIQPYQQPGP